MAAKTTIASKETSLNLGKMLYAHKMQNELDARQFQKSFGKHANLITSFWLLNTETKIIREKLKNL